jgi:hypothetical protein
MVVQVSSNPNVTLTVVLLDDTKEIQQGTITGNNEPLQFTVGTITATGPFDPSSVAK